MRRQKDEANVSDAFKYQFVDNFLKSFSQGTVSGLSSQDPLSSN